jgi:hypothetical protein
VSPDDTTPEAGLGTAFTYTYAFDPYTWFQFVGIFIVLVAGPTAAPGPSVPSVLEAGAGRPLLFFSRLSSLRTSLLSLSLSPRPPSCASLAVAAVCEAEAAAAAAAAAAELAAAK